MNFFSHPQPNENDIFWSELMNTSRVTNRGGTYSSKSKSNSSIFGNQDAWKEQDHRKMGTNSMRFSENSLTVGINMKKRLPMSFSSAAEEMTNKKSPVYKQIIFEEKKISAKKSLLYSQLSKRTFNQYEPKKRLSLFQQIPLKERNLFPIKQELQNGQQNRISSSSIDTYPENRFSNETDISSQ